MKVSKFAVAEDTSRGIVLPAFLAILLLVVVLAVVIIYRKRSLHRELLFLPPVMYLTPNPFFIHKWYFLGFFSPGKTVKAYTKIEKFAERHEGFRKLNTHDTDDDDSGDSDTEVFNRASTVRQ